MPKMESAMRHVFEIECKDKGFLNESVSDFHQSCIKPLIFLRFCYFQPPFPIYFKENKESTGVYHR